MEKEFVSYNIAVRLKELGFNEPCFGRWWFRADMHKLNEEELEIIRSNYFELPEHYILAPTFSQAFRWFREKHNIDGLLHKTAEGSYYFWITECEYENYNHYKYYNQMVYFNTYEEAELACLENLIELVESKSE
jgi:hypothetical protein